MNVAEFTELVQARPAGLGKWQARCQAHEDHSPSLSIAEGRDGRVLVRCWAGCTTENICASLGITLRDLFAGEPLTPEQRAMAAHQKALRDAAERQQRAIERAARDRLRKLERLMDALGGKLALNPDDGELGSLFHEVSDELHELESAERHYEDGPLRSTPMPEIPQWIRDALGATVQAFQIESPQMPSTLTFDELAEWLQLQKETARCERAA